MKEPWKPLRHTVLPEITLEQAQSIIAGAGFKMGLLKVETVSGEGEDTQIVVNEMPNVSEAFLSESMAQGRHLPWSTHEWLAEAFFEQTTARLAAESFRV